MLNYDKELLDIDDSGEEGENKAEKDSSPDEEDPAKQHLS